MKEIVEVKMYCCSDGTMFDDLGRAKFHQAKIKLAARVEEFAKDLFADGHYFSSDANYDCMTMNDFVDALIDNREAILGLLS